MKFMLFLSYSDAGNLAVVIGVPVAVLIVIVILIAIAIVIAYGYFHSKRGTPSTPLGQHLNHIYIPNSKLNCVHEQNSYACIIYTSLGTSMNKILDPEESAAGNSSSRGIFLILL